MKPSMKQQSGRPDRQATLQGLAQDVLAGNAHPQRTEVKTGPEVFISYRRLDDEPPPGRPDNRGFVNYLLGQVRWALRQKGVPDAILWQDRSQIDPGDVFSEAILNALNKAELFVAVLSKNYITSDWCADELRTMGSRVGMLAPPDGRIFRIDKHKVPEDDIPEALRRIQAVRFYREDPGAKHDYEFFWRGKVRFPRQYEQALDELTLAIRNRLEKLGLPTQPKRQPQPRLDNARASNKRVLFVAKPAVDMVEFYETLVDELCGRGFRITPDPDKNLGNMGEEVRSAVVKALAEAEASIHLLGTRTGGRPDGLNMDLVPMQLAAAADEAKRRPGDKVKGIPGFERMIWAPDVLPAETSARAKRTRRDPLKILKRFGQRLLEMDQIDGDTASRFNEFVLQRLERRQPMPAGGKLT